MKAIYYRAAGAIALSMTIAACVPKVTPPLPAPAPVQRPAPTPTPAPVVQQQTYENWMDAPQTPGDWIYGDQSNGGMALYRANDRSALFMLECDREGPWIALYRESSSQAARTGFIRTETATKSVEMTSFGSGVAVFLPPRDPIFDAMALSKGRFAVEVEGLPTLYLPSWAEVSRVIEDCR